MPAKLAPKPTDNLVSAVIANSTTFLPSYETESKVSINHLLTQKYRKQWFQEEKKHYSKISSRESMVAQQQSLNRRFVQKLHTCNIPTKHQVLEREIQLKFGRNPNTKPLYMKYKITECPKSAKKRKSTAKTDQKGDRKGLGR